MNVDREKTRWLAEEVRLITRAETTVTSAEGVLFMNQYFQEFPHLEAIKNKCRQETYRKVVRSFY